MAFNIFSPFIKYNSIKYIFEISLFSISHKLSDKSNITLN